MARTNRTQDLAELRAVEVAGFDLHIDRADIGLEVYTRDGGAGQIVAKAFTGRAGRPTWHYRFRNADHLAAEIARTVKSREADARYKAQRKAEKAAAVTVNVGDIFRASWGYDQTNIDYYEVVRVVGAKTVEVRPVAAAAWEQGHMQGRCVPLPGEFVGPVMRKRVRATGDDGAAITINSFTVATRINPVVDGVPAYASSVWTAYA